VKLWQADPAGEGHSLVLEENALGALDVAATGFNVDVVIRLPRDQVQHLAQALDEWLFESRPA